MRSLLRLKIPTLGPGLCCDSWTRGEVGEMLALSFQETEEFLHLHQVERVTVAEYEQDAQALQQILAR